MSDRWWWGLGSSWLNQFFHRTAEKLAESYLAHLVAAGAGKGEMVEVVAGSRLHLAEMIRDALDGVDCVQIPADPGAGAKYALLTHPWMAPAYCA